MYGTKTNTNTYTVIDIRKTFENCEADIRTIARRTGKWTMDFVDNLMHDILKLAENGYIATVSIALKETNDTVKRATKFTINESGNNSDSARPGQNNDWENIINTHLTVYLAYTTKWQTLTEQQKKDFQCNNYFRIGWTTTTDDTSFSHLNSGNAQLYANKGYELQKTNFK
jgi:hypothetical protein